MKRLIAFLLVLVMLLSLCACGESRGGDGVSTCRNCGRKTSLVAGYGYCKTCYEGFIEWQKDYYGD